MSAIATTTAFRLVRRIATAGENNPALYLLIAEAADLPAIRSDFEAEVHVQLESGLRCLVAEDLSPERLEDTFSSASAPKILLITFDRWNPELIQSIDRNVVLLTGNVPVLLLTKTSVADRILSAAPNLRSRLTDILTVTPDGASHE